MMSLLLVMAMGVAGGQAPDGPPRTVPRVDLERYQGRWFEIARYPNRFQTSCAGDVVAEYSIRSDGRLDVVNQCRKSDGSASRAAGVARRAGGDPSGARLEVRFAPAWLSFLPAVWGDYWVLALAEDYSWAVVGSPDRKYLWVLARSPEVSPELYARLAGEARAQGFDPARLVRTAQTGAVPGR